MADLSMQAAPATPDTIRQALRRRAPILLVLLATLLASFYLIWLANNSEGSRWFSSIPFICVPFAASIKMFLTARRCSGDAKRAWFCFSLACLFFTCAEAHWMFYEVVYNDPTPSPSLGDIGYYSFPILFVLGIWHYNIRAQPVGVPLSQIGNLGIIVSALMLAYLFQYYELVKVAPDLPEVLTAIAYGIFDISSFLFALVVLSLHVWGKKRNSLVLIVCALAMLATTDFFYAFALLHQNYVSTGWIGVLYPLVFVTLFMAAYEQDQLPDVGEELSHDPAFTDPSAQWETLVAPLAVTIVVATAFTYREVLTTDVVAYALVPITLFVISLALRNWWGHKAETQLRSEAIASKFQLQVANQGLWDEMQNRSRIEDELRHSQKMEAVGQLTGGVAHDFNNLLAVIITNLEIAEQFPKTQPALQECLHDASAAALRAASLTKQLLSLSRKQALNAESISTSQLLNEMRALLERTLDERIQIKIETSKDLRNCIADRSQFENAILNLAINSRDAMPAGGELAIRASNIVLDETHAAEHPESKPGSYVKISVTDTGSGIDSDVLSRVFEPFFTTKDIGAGTGLGLSMVYGFAKQSGGHLTIESEVGRGTEICIYLPSAEQQPQAPQTKNDADIPEGRGETIFVVEDEAAVRKLVVKLAKELGYDVVAAASDGTEALALASEIESIDLLLSDVILPGDYSGAEVAAELRRKRPGIRVLLMSGYAPESVLVDAQLEPDIKLLHKPFRAADLARAIRGALDA
ncbi:MAG: response regulator [Myxococcales bacterium]|nr:response regulator [Myxococcales bacterium]